MALFNPAVPQYPQPNYMNYQPQIPQQSQQHQSNGIVWVQGENAAKSYPVAPGNTLLMLDSEDSIFYIKTVDASGMPAPLRMFSFTEVSAKDSTHEDYITRKEFEEKIEQLLKKEEKKYETKERQSLI